MKIKKKLILALLSAFVLLTLIGASGFFHVSTTANGASVSSATISAVESGTTSTSSITVGPNPTPIGQTVSIDLRITNGAGIWGWSISSVTWNPQVLNLTTVQEGPYLADNTADASPFFVGSPGSNLWWVNTLGQLYSGLNEALPATGTSIESSGVLANLTFVVVGTGTSQIGIAGANLRVSPTDSTGTNIACNNATIISTLTAITSTPTPSPTPGSSTNPTSTPTATPTSSSTPTAKPTATSSSQPTSTPEFPALMLLPIFTVTSAAVLAYRFNRRKQTPAA